MGGNARIVFFQIKKRVKNRDFIYSHHGINYDDFFFVFRPIFRRVLNDEFDLRKAFFKFKKKFKRE